VGWKVCRGSTSHPPKEIPLNNLSVVKGTFSRQILFLFSAVFMWNFVTSKNMNVFHLVYVFSRYYLENSIWVNIYTVDSRWLYSLFWCMNVTSVTTNKCHDFSQMTRPVWHMVCKRKTVDFYGQLHGSQMCLLHLPVFTLIFVHLLCCVSFCC